jgi:MFS family permease
MPTVGSRTLTFAMFAAFVAAMTGIVAFPALLPAFRAAWDLSNLEAGVVSGAFFAGYAVAVPVLTGLTDRIDPKRVVIMGLAVSLLGLLGFAATAGGTASATAWRLVQGIGLAGTYMPGIKALADAVPERDQPGAVGFATASFTVGNAVSFLLAGALADRLGWPATFAWLAAGPALALLLVLLVLPARPPARGRDPVRLLDLRPALRNRRALGYMAGYFVHNAESSSMRAWAVGYLAFAQAQQAGAGLAAALSPTVVAALGNLVGLPAILAANALGGRLGRRPVIVAVMLGGGAIGIALGLATAAPMAIVVTLLLVYGMCVTADSGSLNAALVSVADAAERGRMLAAHALCGFVGGALGPILFGAVLDATGGAGAAGAWLLAFVAMAVLVVLGALAVLRGDRGAG